MLFLILYLKFRLYYSYLLATSSELNSSSFTMVRKYVRNLGRGPGVVEAALETIKAGTMSVREASKNFGINEATLQDKLKHVDSQRGWHGVVTAIPKEESEFAHLLTLKSK